MAVRLDSQTDNYIATNGAVGTTFSAVAWAYLVSNPIDFSMILAWENAATNATQYIDLGMGSSKDFQVYSNGGAVSTGYTFPLTTWVRVGIVVNGTACTVYWGTDSGALSSNSSTISNATRSHFFVGSDSFTNEWFNGRIASVKVWQAALTAAEIEAELAQYVPQRTANLLRWHPFVNAETTDYSGNGNTLTAGSSATTTEDGPPIRWGRSRGPRVKLSPTGTNAPAGAAAASAAANNATTTVSSNVPAGAGAATAAAYNASAVVANGITTLTDDFDDNSRDTVKWPNTFGTTSETGGQARVPAAAGGTVANGYGSAASYFLKDSAALVKVTAPSLDASTFAWGALTIYADAPTYTTFARVNLIRRAGGLVVAGAVVVSSSTVYSASDTAVADAPTWLRLRESAGTLYADYSADGASWTNAWSFTTPSGFLVGGMELDLEAQRSATTGDGTAAAFDNVNLAGTSAPAEVATSSAAAQSATAKVAPVAGAGAATAAAYNASVTTSQPAPAAAASAAASNAAPNVGGRASAGTATAAALQASATTSQPASAGAGAASAAGLAATGKVAPTAGAGAATAAALQASAITSQPASASAAASAAAALAGSARVAPPAGAGAATAAAHDATVRVAPAAGLATVTAAALQASGSTTTDRDADAELAQASAAALDAQATTSQPASAGAATSAAVALSASVTTSQPASAGAGAAAAAALPSSPSVGPAAGSGATSATAHNATARVTTSAELATASAAGYDGQTVGEGGAVAGRGQATAAAHDATTNVVSHAQAAAVVAAGLSGTPSVGTAAGTATAAAVGRDADADSAGETFAPAGAGEAQATAYEPQRAIATTAEAGAATAAAHDASARVAPTAGLATASSSAVDARAGVAPRAGAAAVSADGLEAAAEAGALGVAGRGRATAAAYDASVRISAHAGLAQVVALAARAIVRAQDGRHSAGSWLGLVALLAALRLEPQPPELSCPHDGEPYRTDEHGQLYCPFDGYRPSGIGRVPAAGRDYGGLRAASLSAPRPMPTDALPGWGPITGG